MQRENERLHRAYALLLAATFKTPRPAARLRRAALCHDGTPIVYSHELGHNAKHRPLRMLVEPGGVGISVAEQIDWSLRATDELLGILDSREAAEEINAIASRTFPRRAETVRNWWGGMWLGLAAGPVALELRLYLSLRHGPVQDRWQRVANVLGLFGDDRLDAPLHELARRTLPHAIPVGLGLVVSAGRVQVLRLYVGVYRPSEEVIGALVPSTGDDTRVTVAMIWETFCHFEGVFGAQSVTVGYDFRRDESGTIFPTVARTKIDVSCQFVPPSRRAHIIALAAQLAREWHLPPVGLESLPADLVAAFGGYDVEYVSIGLADRPSGLTIYAKPHGYTGL